MEKYRLQSRGGKGVKNMAVTPRIGVSGIQLVDDTSELMVISEFGKIIRIDTKDRGAAQGVRLHSADELNGNNHNDRRCCSKDCAFSDTPRSQMRALGAHLEEDS